jgi:carbonic anhydrase
MNQNINFYALVIAVLAGQTPVYGDSPHWTYEDQHQPGGWGAVEGNEAPAPYNYPYAECAIGSKQTPVDIANVKITPIMNGITFNWKPFTADFYNTGHAIQVQPVDATIYSGTTKLGKTSYPLLQAHLHTHGEHTLNGKQYEAEIHFVNARTDGGLAVVGLLIEIGRPNDQIQLMLDNTVNAPGEKTHNPTNIVFDPRKLLPKGIGSGKFFTYSGSLTTPPCTEGVNWYVYEKPITISAAQLKLLKSFYDGNYRDLQGLNGRQLVTNK